MTDLSGNLLEISCGNSGYPLWTVDQAHPAPLELRLAASQMPFSRNSGDYYPGLRAPAPPGYAEWAAAFLGQILCGNRPCEIDIKNVAVSIACDDPGTLSPIQLIPHFDSTDADLLACVHYLCEPPFLGTGFFRHRRSGLERIGPTALHSWEMALAADARDHGLPKDHFVDSDSASFEMIGEAELRFNRLVVYPANCLHSGLLNGTTLNADPAKGRLTITTLAHVRSN